MSLTNFKNSQPLPPNPYECDTLLFNAYEQCLSLERRESWSLFLAELDKQYSHGILQGMSPRTAGRVLGYALRLAPSVAGRDALEREINICGGDFELLGGLAHLYVYGLIRIFYNPKGHAPTISASQSPRRSFKVAVQELEYLLQKPSINPHDLRKLVLARDNYRCVFTGGLDFNSWNVDHDLNELPFPKPCPTHTAHIISQSLSDDIEGASEAVSVKFNWAKTAGAIIERFGGFSSSEVLDDRVLNSPSNAFTAEAISHGQFDDLALWLIPAKDEHGLTIPNTYDVHHIEGSRYLSLFGVKSRIAFSSKTIGGKVIAAPDERLIALHAACARIAHMSGAAGYLKENFRHADNMLMTEPYARHELARALRRLALDSPG
ncbi:hypothetical protein NP233_g8768 [Leucocoprinus birnbaumii]|uniref:HNH nuclease domain-containing protein n=1 Tax=Leucocoprinus birnbaumii TaxID=56174 RepID=A0AAD5YNS1_9AGAR|nr:hypothetical protein NP233_g8768 [Leucocoprinus birnbaumii]